jgi:hypothetical protein
MNPIEFAKLH